ncbi:tRNA methyltransferase 2 [Mitosporidium daphniae]
MEENAGLEIVAEPSKEECKLCLQNVPRYLTAKELTPKLQDLLKEFQHEYKVQKDPKKDTCIMIFPSQGSLSDFQDFISNKKILYPKCKKPLSINSLTKRKLNVESDAFYSISKKNSSLPESERIQDQVTKFWRYPYSEQLELKKKMASSALSRINYSHVIEDVVASPVLTGYRNKCEFTIGFGGESGKDPIVGFTMGSYMEENLSVCSPDPILIVHPGMKAFVAAFNEWLISAHYQQDRITPVDALFAVYNRITHCGFWRLLLLRLMDDGKLMALISVTKLSSDANYPLKGLEEFCRSFSWEGQDNKNVSVASLSYQESSSLSLNFDFSKPLVSIYGPKSLPMTILDFKFEVSIEAFFQANVYASEKLFTLAGSFIADGSDATSSVQKNRILLDLCCGSGTIGIILSSFADHVVGIELIAEAIEDAKRNAAINGISEKSEWIAGPVETILPKVLSSHSKSDEFVVILDPPRNGVKKEVIHSLRSNPLIKKVIYISCKADLAAVNFEDLCRSTSKRYPGGPFCIKRAIPVDLFPQTDHYELLLLFERN